MITSLVCASALILCALIELLFPGNDVYHYGWFNVLLAALIAVALMPLPRAVGAIKIPRARAALAACIAGGVVAGFATIASGLLGPDSQLLVAAPGATVRVDALGGSLVFPIAPSNRSAQSGVQLVRGGDAQTITGRRYDGPFLLEAVARDVVAVDVSDVRGGHLTMTQPTGNTFLSPVLLMQSQQTIAGMTVPYDSFAVPAAHRVVKAVYFSAQEAARMPSIGAAVPVVLFDVENDNEVEVKNGIGIARDGARVTLGGLQLEPHVFNYPAVNLVSVPDIRVVGFAVALAIAGAALMVVRAPARVRGSS